MNDQDKTKEQLISELEALRQRVALLEDTDRQQRQTEVEFARHKAILTAAIECLPFDFFALDTEGRCILQNEVSRRYFGNALGKTAEEVCPDKRVVPRWLEGNRRALAGEQLHEEATWEVGGELRSFYSILAPIRHDGTLYGMLGVNVDITQRKRAEESLRDSESRYRALTESTQDIIYVLNRQGSLLYANQAASRSIGIPADQIPGKQQADLFPPEMAQNHLRRIADVLASGEAQAQDELFHFGPHEIWLRVHLLPLRDAQGQINSVMGVCHDITARKRTEAALQEAHDQLEARVQERTAELLALNEQLRREIEVRRQAEHDLAIFKRFADSSGRGFGMADLQGRITYVNATMCRILGEDDPHAAIGEHFSAYCPEEYRQLTEEEVLPAVLSQGQWDGESAILTRQGAVIPTWENAFLISDPAGQPLCLALAVADLTERKRTEQALRQSYDELRAIYDQVRDGIIVVDVVTGHPVRSNPAYCCMLGYSEEEVLTLLPQRVHSPEVLPRVREHLEAATRDGVNRIEDLPFLCKNGTTIYADVVTSRIVYNQRPAWISFFHEVTQRKAAEQALEHEHRTLKHLLQSSDHERQLIAYEIHDGLAQQLAGAIMQFQTYGHLKETRPKEAAKAFDAGLTMLQQSHFETRRLISGVRPPILDEAGIVAAVSHLINEERGKKGPTIEFQAKVEFEWLTPILENAIYRIVQEALTNACRHSKSKKIRVELIQQGDRLRIEVRDRGIGFQPETIGEGHFGTAGIRERARLLGGKATIESQPGKGTRVVVELPIVLRRPEDESSASEDWC